MPETTEVPAKRGILGTLGVVTLTCFQKIIFVDTLPHHIALGRDDENKILEQFAMRPGATVFF